MAGAQTVNYWVDQFVVAAGGMKLPAGGRKLPESSFGNKHSTGFLLVQQTLMQTEQLNTRLSALTTVTLIVHRKAQVPFINFIFSYRSLSKLQIFHLTFKRFCPAMRAIL